VRSFSRGGSWPASRARRRAAALQRAGAAGGSSADQAKKPKSLPQGASWERKLLGLSSAEAPARGKWQHPDTLSSQPGQAGASQQLAASAAQGTCTAHDEQHQQSKSNCWWQLWCTGGASRATPLISCKDTRTIRPSHQQSVPAPCLDWCSSGQEPSTCLRHQSRLAGSVQCRQLQHLLGWLKHWSIRAESSPST